VGTLRVFWHLLAWELVHFAGEATLPPTAANVNRCFSTVCEIVRPIQHLLPFPTLDLLIL
jgi:hypothetical protein